MSPRISLANLKEAETTRSRLRLIARRLQFPRVDLAIQGHLSLELDGRLEHRHLGTRDELPSSLEALLETEESRQFLASMLGELAPRFSSPLYVGVSVHLRNRLSQHRACIERHAAVATSVPVDGEDAYRGDQSFGAEVHARGIDRNDLLVCVHPVVATAIGFDVRRAVEGLETLINRVFYPILGRR